LEALIQSLLQNSQGSGILLLHLTVTDPFAVRGKKLGKKNTPLTHNGILLFTILLWCQLVMQAPLAWRVEGSSLLATKAKAKINQSQEFCHSRLEFGTNHTVPSTYHLVL
jgi:hypothetical protein